MEGGGITTRSLQYRLPGQERQSVSRPRPRCATSSIAGTRG